MIPIMQQERDNEGLVHLATSTHALIEKTYDNLIRSMELASRARDRYPEPARAELADGAILWKERKDKFNQIIAETEMLQGSVLDKLIQLLPASVSGFRASLLRLSPVFINTFSEFGPDRLDILGSVITNYGKQSPDVAINVLNSCLDGAPVFYAPLMLKGMIQLENNIRIPEAAALFQRAAEHPPKGDHRTMFMIAALELQAESLIRANRAGEATSIYRRIGSILEYSPAHAYHLVRTFAITQQTGSAMEVFAELVRDTPTFYSLTLISDDMKNIQTQVIQLLVEQADELREVIAGAHEIAENIMLIASDYDLTEQPGVSECQQQLANLHETAEHGSLSGFHDLGLRMLPEWTQTCGGRIQDTLQNSLSARRESIREYNDKLKNLVKKRHLHWLKSWGVILLILGASLLVLLLALQFSFSFSSSVFAIWILGAYAIRFLYDLRLDRKTRKQQKDLLVLEPIRDDISRIAQYRSEMMIQLEKSATFAIGRNVES